jgi:hypothetical protein
MIKTRSRPLTFGELDEEEYFIGFPLDGDDEGHGGFRNGSYVFRKVSPIEDGFGVGRNAIRLNDGNLSHMPNGMMVLKVFLSGEDYAPLTSHMLKRTLDLVLPEFHREFLWLVQGREVSEKFLMYLGANPHAQRALEMVIEEYTIKAERLCENIPAGSFKR